MDNVPSSAILTIIAIVAACLIGAFMFNVVNGQKASGNNSVSKVESMNKALDESNVTQYNNMKVTGSQVKGAIELLQNDPVSIVVIQKDGTTSTTYNYLVESDESVKKQDAATQKTNLSNMNDKSKTTYLSAAARYIGEVTRSAKTNEITKLTFTYTE